jgi:Condensation domain
MGMTGWEGDMPASKSAELCWGQRYHWLRYQQVPAGSRHEAHITDTSPVPEGVTVAQLRSALTYLTRRHEVMRTVYDLHASPRPRQRVMPPGPVELATVTTEQDGTPSPAEAVRALSARDFDLAREWPVRACAITTGGVPKRLHMVFNHLAFDDQSLAVLREEIAAVLTALTTRRPAQLPPVPYQPVDVARYEQARSGTAQRGTAASHGAGRPAAAVEAALGHWRTDVAGLPADVFARRRTAAPAGTAAPTGTGAAHSASLTSPALLTDARDIAGRLRVWPSAVHLAAYAVVLAAYTGEDLVAHRMYTSQREASGHGAVMTCMSSPALIAVDLADDPPFGEVARRAAARVEQGLAHAHVPYDVLVEETARESARRGQPVRVASELNFLTFAPQPCGVRRERFTRNAAPADWARAGSDTYLRVYEWADGTTLMLQAMDAVMDAAAVEAFLRGYARVLEAHRDPGTDLRVSEAARLTAFGNAPARTVVRAGRDAVDPEETAAALRGHPAVVSAAVTRQERGLVAEVSVNSPVTPAELRLHLLDAMYERVAVRCPDWFRVTGPGAAPAAEGDGRDGAPRRPGTEAERVLAEVVAEVNGLAGVDFSTGYTGAGGRTLLAPRVLTELQERGWDGLGLGDLASARPLPALAARMARRPGA